MRGTQTFGGSAISTQTATVNGVTDIRGLIISNVRDLKINTREAAYMSGALVVPKV